MAKKRNQKRFGAPATISSPAPSSAPEPSKESNPARISKAIGTFLFGTCFGLAISLITAALQIAGVISLGVAHFLMVIAFLVVGFAVWNGLSVKPIVRIALVVILGFMFLAADRWMVWKKEQQENSETSFIANRAYVDIAQIEVPEFIVDKPTMTRITWRNDGGSPANVYDGHFLFIADKAVPTIKDCVPSGESAQPFTIPPRTGKTTEYGTQFSAERIGALAEGRLILRVCGEVMYETLGRKDKFKFYVYWDRESGRWLEIHQDSTK